MRYVPIELWGMRKAQVFKMLSQFFCFRSGHDGFWNGDPNSPFVFESIVTSITYRFQDNDIFLQTGISLYLSWYLREWALSRVFNDGIWKSDHAIFFHCSLEVAPLSCTVSDIMRRPCRPVLTSSLNLCQWALFTFLLAYYQVIVRPPSPARSSR